jgi:hypothetical protein
MLHCSFERSAAPSRANERDILLVGLRVPIQLQVVAVLLAVDVVDLVPELPAVHGQCL